MTIEFFGPKGDYWQFSNFYRATIHIEDREWPTNEHFFQASKATNVEDRERIANAETPALAKKLGRACKLRQDWEEVVGTKELHKLFTDDKGVVVYNVKDHYMYSALIAKFTQHPELYKLLCSTGDQEIIEASPTDYYWGVGKDGTGANKLGRMLQFLRRKFLEVKDD